MHNNWYALKVFYNRVQPLIADCKEQGMEFFAPSEVVRSLLFLQCTEEALWAFLATHPQGIYLYRQAGSRRPAVIRDHEMEVFRFVVTSGQQGLTFLGEDRAEYHQGDRVVVTGGPFKGAEGHIKRIKKDRRLVVTIPGVVAVATAYIHPSLLRRVEGAAAT
ncbi:MAG: KOW motif-containing protein [Bacteroidales bacterium]|nr:KOW motif-containing protein [Bacteroidales bacterium]